MKADFSVSGIPLPPPDNKLVKHGRYGTYGTADYQDWFLKVRSLLLDALGDRPVDTSEWWRVEIRLRLGKSDGPNHTKAILDWLTGRYTLEKATEINGVKRSKGAIIIGRGLWNDDRRVRSCSVEVQSVRCAEPSFAVECWTAPAPLDEAATAKALAVAAKDAERNAARASREAEKAQIRAAAEAAKTKAREEAEAELHAAVRHALVLLGPTTQFKLARFAQLSEGSARRALTDLQLKGEVQRTGKGWSMA